MPGMAGIMEGDLRAVSRSARERHFECWSDAGVVMPSWNRGIPVHNGRVSTHGEGSEPAEIAKSAGRARVSLASVGLLGLLRALAKREEDREEPGAVWATPRIESLATFAIVVAKDVQDDSDAVKKLRIRAKGRRGPLRRAAAFVRFSSLVHEDGVADRANRLLKAAGSGTAVEPVAEEDKQRFDRIATFAAQEYPDAYAALADMEPRLLSFKDDLVGAARVAAGQNGGLLSSEQNLALLDLLYDGLTALIGPDSAQTDDLLVSQTAFDRARFHLVTLAGLRLLEDSELLVDPGL